MSKVIFLQNKYFTAFLIVSVTRMRRDTEMLCFGNKFNIASNDHESTIFWISSFGQIWSKNQNCQSKLKFGILPKSNMLNSI